MAQQTLNLKKLEEKFEALFKEETEESFNKWLADKQQQNNNNMAQQTAVEWFAGMITEMIHEAYHSELADLFEQAKEIEKQQREISQMDMFYYINNRNFGEGYIERRDEAKKYIEQYTTKNI
jgi:hypothetical protein